MAEPRIPAFVSSLLWDVDPERVDLDEHRDLVIERVMSRGGWEAMKWLRGRYSSAVLAEFLRREGTRKLAPRDLAYWSLVCEVDLPIEVGGGRPRWAGA